MARKKKRMGRPPKPPGERRTINISVHVTRAELRKIDAEARKLGLSRSGLLMRPFRGKE